MAAKPRPGTHAFTVRDVAMREGWSERTADAILKDGIDNGHRAYEHQRELERRGIEQMKETGEIPVGRKGERDGSQEKR